MKSHRKYLIIALLISSCTQPIKSTNTPIGDTTTVSPIAPVEPPKQEIKRETFEGQELKDGEKIIKINWGTENTVHLARDYYGGHYASKSRIIPSGKKWVLLYAKEDYTYSKSTISVVPLVGYDKNVDNSIDASYGSNDNINLSRAKDENRKYYSGTRIIGIADREIHDTYA